MICALWLLCIVYRCSLTHTHTHRHHITHKHMWRATRQMGPGDRMHFKCSPQTHHTQIIIGMQHKSDWILMGRTSKEALGDGIFHSAACQNEVFLLCFSFFFLPRTISWCFDGYRYIDTMSQPPKTLWVSSSTARYIFIVRIYRNSGEMHWSIIIINNIARHR